MRLIHPPVSRADFRVIVLRPDLVDDLLSLRARWDQSEFGSLSYSVTFSQQVMNAISALIDRFQRTFYLHTFQINSGDRSRRHVRLLNMGGISAALKQVPHWCLSSKSQRGNE